MHRNHKSQITNHKSARGFTLIELIIVIGFFGFMSALLMQNLLSVYKFKEVIRYYKDLNFEASAVLSNGIPGLIRSGFAINYAQTEEGDAGEQITEGWQDKTDKLSIYTDRAETQYFTIYRETENSDIARLMVEFSNGEKFPLHSSETVIEDFDIEVPQDPRISGDRDIQPYVNIYVRARHRYPFGESADESELMAHQTIRASYRTTITLRNTQPSSYKTEQL